MQNWQYDKYDHLKVRVSTKVEHTCADQSLSRLAKLGAKAVMKCVKLHDAFCKLAFGNETQIREIDL